jgi:predicted DNA-binding protein (UPF0251 family)
MRELMEVRITVDELEALRLADLLGLSHEEAGEQMAVSRATFGRIVGKARKTVADALVHGKALMVEGGPVAMRPGPEMRRFSCRTCGGRWDEPFGTGRPQVCPSCGEEEVFRYKDDEMGGEQP